MKQFIQSKRFLLFLAVLLLSIHQSTILAYYDFGQEAVLANLDRIPSAHVPNALVLSYIGRLELAKICTKMAVYAIPLFLIQAVFAAIYCSADSVKSKRYAALTIWLLPALLGAFTVVGTAVYLMSPLFTVVTFPGFMLVRAGEQTHVEDFTEGWIPAVATIGWFHLFWLAVTIRAWFFRRY
ncbi:hypothetical protein ACQ4M3_21135 [Leptolyngbya sp. AN03gr2]|uniref:hypothetical protein n=1 Tax=unclassified Leptolyngbya TaxID=2650499 RepID=UPI003D317D41